MKEQTLVCPNCGETLIGDEPAIEMLCENCKEETIEIAKIETFASNKEWLKTVHDLEGNRAFSDTQVNEMTEEEATQIAKNIMEE